MTDTTKAAEPLTPEEESDLRTLHHWPLARRMLATLDAEREARARTEAAWQERAEALWAMLDNISTLDDACRENTWLFRERARDEAEKRSEVAQCLDGQTITWLGNPGADALRAYVEREAAELAAVSDGELAAIREGNCPACYGSGHSGGFEHVPAMEVTNPRTGKKRTTTAGVGHVTRVCEECDGTGSWRECRDDLRAELARVEIERDEWKSVATKVGNERFQFKCERDEAEAGRDEALARIETLRVVAERGLHWSACYAIHFPTSGADMDTEDGRKTLDATAPGAPSILDAVRAEAWDEGFWACVSDPVPTPKDRPSINPYRARTTDGGSDGECE